MTKINQPTGINSFNNSIISGTPETRPEHRSIGTQPDLLISIRFIYITTIAIGNSSFLTRVSKSQRVHTTVGQLYNLNNSHRVSTKPYSGKHRTHTNQPNKTDSTTMAQSRTAVENYIYSAIEAANKDNWKEAEYFFIQAIQVNPNQEEPPGLTYLGKNFCKKYYLHFGIAFLKQKLTDKAEIYLKKSFDLSADYNSCFFLGKCYSSQGKYKLALEYFEKAKSFNPNNSELNNDCDFASQQLIEEQITAFCLLKLNQNCEKI